MGHSNWPIRLDFWDSSQVWFLSSPSGVGILFHLRVWVLRPFIKIKSNKSNSFFIPGQLALIRVRDKNVSGRKTLVLSVIRKDNAEKHSVLRNLKSPRLLSKLRKKTHYLINLNIKHLNPRVACSSILQTAPFYIIHRISQTGNHGDLGIFFFCL